MHACACRRFFCKTKKIKIHCFLYQVYSVLIHAPKKFHNIEWPRFFLRIFCTGKQFFVLLFFTLVHKFVFFFRVQLIIHIHIRKSGGRKREKKTCSSKVEERKSVNKPRLEFRSEIERKSKGRYERQNYINICMELYICT